MSYWGADGASGPGAPGVSTETLGDERVLPRALHSPRPTATCGACGICCGDHVLSNVRRVSPQHRRLDRCLRVTGQTGSCGPHTFTGGTVMSLVSTEVQGSAGQAVGSCSRPLPISLSQKHLCPAPPSAGPAVLCLQRQSPAGPRPGATRTRAQEPCGYLSQDSCHALCLSERPVGTPGEGKQGL